MVTRVPSVLPLSAENQALVRQHVPEAVLGQLEDWTREIPMVECISYAEMTSRGFYDAPPAALHGRVFFMHRFTGASEVVVNGVALVCFSKIGHELQASICAFEQGEPYSFFFRRSGLDREHMIDGRPHLWASTSYRDRMDRYWASSGQPRMNAEIQTLLSNGGRAAIPLPPVQPIDRAWYLRIADAVSRFFNGFLICLSDLLRSILSRIERVITRG